MKKYTILFGLLIFLAACQYESIKLEEIPPPPPIDTTVDLSFATEIVPIFTDGNNCTACHKTGGTAPDLSAANAYQSLVNGSYVVSNNPEASKIYTYPNTSSGGHVWKVYTNHQAELLFTWINQGAKNN